MAVIGTFGSFTAARLGIYASQAALNVTGNNIANINTKGYCRQRLDLVSLNSAGSGRYSNSFNMDIGYGVLAESTSQLRDPFMDIRYRNEQSSVGAYEARVDGLQLLTNILDEVGKGEGEFGIIEAQFNDLIQQLQILSRNANDDVMDTNVRSSAESLVTLFNSYAKGLTTAKDTLTDNLKEEVKSVNTMLDQIRDLNVQIREANIYGDSALELKDTRNVLIDDLSTHLKVDVRYGMEKIDEYNEVEKLTITIADSGYPPIKLIDGIYGGQLSMPETIAERNPNYKADLPTSCRYISQDSAVGDIKYTNIKREALRNDDGKIITNDDAGEALIKQMKGFENGLSGANMYRKGEEGTAGKYIIRDANGDITDYTDIASEANQITNAITGSEDNRLWMQAQPLKDERGRYMRDENDREIKEVIDLSDTVLYGSLQTRRELLTEEGEFASGDDVKFDPNANIKRGFPYYQHALDALARKFAEIMNEANTVVKRNPDGTIPKDENGVYVAEKAVVGYETEVGADGVERYKTRITDEMVRDCDLKLGKDSGNEQVEKLVERLEKEGFGADYLLRTDLNDLPADLRAEISALQTLHLSAQPEGMGHGMPKMGGGVLFSNRGDTDEWKDITAANISIAKSWSTGETRIVNVKYADGLAHSTASDNITHMISLMEQKIDYLPEEVVADAANAGTKYFTGNFQDMLGNFNHILATDMQSSTTLYNGYNGSALSLDNQRQSVSGVDLNEEATNMMQYQKSYTAACKLMTILDSMLDRLINGTI